MAFCGRRGDVARAAAARYPGSIGLELDLTDGTSVATALDTALEQLGGVDILILNSGGPPPGSASELTATELAGSLQTLVLAQIDIVARLLPAMRTRRWGRIVAVGSSGIQQPVPNLARSNAARAALAGYLKTLSNEVAGDGVTVNMVLPGRIDTDRLTQLDEVRARTTGTDVESVRDRSRSAIPAGRYGTPGEFAAMAVFLCGGQASYVNGAQLRVDGGLVGSW